MRSGLQKPGAVPFLALLIFSLLSLVPTLAKEWDFYGYSYSAHLAYLGLPRGDGHGRSVTLAPLVGGARLTGLADSSPRVKNASSTIEPRSRLVGTGYHCRSWLFGDFYSSCIDNVRGAQPHHSAVNTPPRSSFETGPETGHEAVAYSATKGPSSITRGVSALKEFVIKRWDDQQSAQPLPPRHDSIDEISTHATPTVANASVTPATASGQQRQPTPNNELNETPAERVDEDAWVYKLPLLVHRTWQQACITGGQYLGNLTTQSLARQLNQTLKPKYVASHSVDEISLEEQPGCASNRESLDTNSNQSELHPCQTNPQSTLPPNSLELTAGQSKFAGFRRDSEHMCGSSMAIVIALVVGIMWF
ncbi:uncharacterized protein DSM5745_06529 [Aspergillus mulundensis]|uniref:Uncharacterized protein n=1 Tax=Aspergillus mulundensis TaxID=1810919 RepID=A0A3D8RR21_9EURO|nr:Uncharacterized protein DSM5745_06529 [Aspergillus mulundensis]RDW76537.1 Uncharacterized protein DSM5745_06529 [Aspergillus mulundensis]